jgi:hypothetical protein
MNSLLVIEDGTEYEEFARLFLSDWFDVSAAHSAVEALAALSARAADALLVDLRFERTAREALVGDTAGTAARFFGGDHERAEAYLKEHQGALILGELRRAGHTQLAVFVHEFPARQLANLQALYAPLRAVPSFDARAVRAALGASS